MNFEKIINKVLEIADYPADRREEFVSTFYQYFFMRAVAEIRGINSEIADKIVSTSSHGADAESLRMVFEEASYDPKIAQSLEKVSTDVVADIVEDISKNATDEQKRKILEVINSSS